MKKIQILLLCIFSSTILFSQKDKTCDSPKEEVLEDLNSITKCSVETSKKGRSKKTKQISVRVSANKRRFRKKRVEKNNLAANTEVERVGLRQSKSLKIKKDLISLKNNLSKDEVKNAKRFSALDEIPTFKKCRAKKDDARLDCFNTEMIHHINTHLQYPSEAVRDNVEGNFWIRFVIDKNGHVTNVRVVNVGEEGSESLNHEAMRVVSKLPNFLPGKLKGKTMAVKYGFPINFSLEK